jgi:ATP phosphoribosyltransferase
MNQSKILLALPNKGRLQKPTLKLLEEADINVTTTDREYLAETSEPHLQIIFARASDIPVYVHFGTTDLGITGYDLILERSSDVYEVMNLEFGACELVLAVPNNSDIFSLDDLPNGVKVATEFPNITDSYFGEKGKKAEIITVHGATEITPTLGLADAIVDLVSTGNTLKSNNLRPIETILTSTARLVCNKISLRTKEKTINSLVKRLKTMSRAG